VREAGGRPRSRAAVLALFGLALGYFALFVRYGYNIDDEGVILAQYHRTYLGHTLYVDFNVGYTPLAYYFHAALFHLFGVSVVPLRWALALCHATVAALLFVVGRRLVSPTFAALPALLYCAMLSFFPGEFASFNIPYPAWYVVLFFVAGLWTALRFLETDRLAWLAASGLLAGVCLGFKPNVGLFQLAFGGLFLLVALEPPAGGGASRWQAAAWWALLLGVGGGLAAVFASGASGRDFRIFLLPIGALLAALAAGRLSGGAEGGRPRHGLVRGGLVFGAAMAVPVLPWVIGYLRLLGPERFARQVFFVGSGLEHVYYHPFHVADSVDRALVLGAVAAAGVGLLVRARTVRAWPVLAVAAAVLAAGAVALRSAPMPEGLHAAVVSRVEALSFAGTLLVHWAALALALPRLLRRARTRQDLTVLAVVAAALTLYLQLYPRSDFAHLVKAAPLTLVLGAVLAARFAGWFDAAPAAGRTLRVAMVAGVLGFVAFRVTPNLGAVLTWNGGPAWRPHAALGLAHAPVTLEVGRATRLRELHETVAYLQANTAPGERIFPFPAIEILCFLADRPNATRHGYFFPGWPGHEVEAEVISALGADPPRLVVVLHGHRFFFVAAPVYYYALRRFVAEHYRQVASFGPYVVLARRDVPDAELRAPPAYDPDGADVLETRYGARLRGTTAERLAAARALVAERLEIAWEPVVPLLDDADPRVREAAVRALAEAGDPGASVPLADALVRGAVPDHQRLLVLRRLWASGDVRVLPPLLELLAVTTDLREYGTIVGTLEAIGGKLAIADYWFGSDPEFQTAVPPLSDLPRWRRRLANPEDDHRLRVFLARVLPRIGDRGAVGALQVALGSAAPDLRSAAADGLLRLGADIPGLDLLDLLLPLAARDLFVPSLLLTLYERDPAAARARFAEDVVLDGYLNQVELAWVVSATGDAYFRDALERLLASPVRQLRVAALAGLERIADPRARPAIERAAGDPDFEVRELAARALAATSRNDAR
jgi:HEAT repeat protein